jgi:hypothetical protein
VRDSNATQCKKNQIISLIRENLIDLHALHKRLRVGHSNPGHPNRALITVLVPMFLIISSSVYPAIMSGIENKEMKIISKVIAELQQKDNVISNRYQAHMEATNSDSITPSSPTPVHPSPTVLPANIPSPSTSSSSDSAPPMEANATPSPRITQADDNDNTMTAAIINPGDLVHVLWLDDTAGNLDIFHRRVGADFDPITINIMNGAQDLVDPAVAVSGSNVHVVWTDNNEVFYMRSTNGGATFSSAINLSNSAGLSFDPAIAVSGNTVHVVWADDTAPISEIVYKRSTDGGVSFQPTKLISGTPADESLSPDMAVSGNNVHIVWRDTAGGNVDVLYRRSLNGGSTFPNVIKNLSNNAGTSVVPAIAVSGSIIHVVWADATPDPSGDILYRRSLNDGTTFPNVIKNLSSNTGTSFDPAIAVSGNNVHVVWTGDTPENNDILYRRSLNGGDTLPNVIKNLSGDSGFSISPAITAAGSNVYVVWAGFTGNSFEILYRTSANNGYTFPAILSNLSGNAGVSGQPAIAVS